MGYIVPPAALVPPLTFEVWTGRGLARRKVESYSEHEAHDIFEAMERTGKEPSMFLGSMLVRGKG